MVKFIVCSSKPWHRATYDCKSSENPSAWAYASDCESLNSILSFASPEFIFFLHWNWKVPSSIWGKYECICFHMTDVPYGRGGSPLQNLIIDGKTDTMVTALRMEEEMDAGPVYIKEPLRLDGRAEDIYLRAGEISWRMIDYIISERPIPLPQHGEPTFFTRRKPEQSALPQAGSLVEVYDFIRMLDAPTYPRAYLDHGCFRFEFSHASAGDEVVEARVVIKKIK